VVPRRLDKGPKRASANFPIEKRKKAAGVQDASRTARSRRVIGCQLSESRIKDRGI